MLLRNNKPSRPRKKVSDTYKGDEMQPALDHKIHIKDQHLNTHHQSPTPNSTATTAIHKSYDPNLNRTTLSSPILGVEIIELAAEALPERR